MLSLFSLGREAKNVSELLLSTLCYNNARYYNSLFVDDTFALLELKCLIKNLDIHTQAVNDNYQVPLNDTRATHQVEFADTFTWSIPALVL